MIPKECKRLAEVDFPIAEVSKHSAREKYAGTGHPSMLHMWWARRPLAACRSVLLALLWPDPCDPCCPRAFKEKARQLLPSVQGMVGPSDKDLRKALLKFIADFANWDMAANPKYLDVSRTLVKAAHSEESPLVVDPFAGGGSIPLEALRVGCDAFASDLNPVACLILKVMLEDIPRHGPKLAQELRSVGSDVKQEAEKELGQFYPKDPDAATPIAYLWARTVQCESPNCGAETPLLRSLWLSKKTNRKRALRHKVVQHPGEPPHVEFDVFEPKLDLEVPNGTVSRAKAKCLNPACGAVLPPERVRAQLAAQRGGTDVIFDDKGSRTGGALMLAVVTVKPGEIGRHYRLPTDRDYQGISRSQKRLRMILEEWKNNGRTDLCPVPDEPLPPKESHRAVGSQLPLYGFRVWGDLFTARQKVAAYTITKQVMNLNRQRGHGALSNVLACALSRLTMSGMSCTRWNATAEKMQHTFGRQTLPMVWDFAEVAPISECPGNWRSGYELVADVIERYARPFGLGQCEIADACLHPLSNESADVWFTDPPYYDAVPYADLSDFFFVWLKRALQGYPFLRDPFDPSNPLTPKAAEAVQNERSKAIDGRPKDRDFYEDSMARAFAQGRRVLREDGLGSVVFAHKTTEGWEALLSAIIRGGWTITGSWPIATESGTRLNARDTASLATSVHLVCRPREEDASIGDWAVVLRELPKRVGDWMERLEAEGVRGADLVFACIGPALEIFSRYTRVETAEGREVQLPEYLEKVWEVVGRTALEQVLGTPEAQARNEAAGAIEEDARLTALFLWTLQSTNDDVAPSEGSDEGDVSGDDEEEEAVPGKTKGYSLVFDVVRRFAQPLGITLPKWEGRVIETRKGVVRLLPIAERTKQLFGEDGSHAVADRLEMDPVGTIRQLTLFSDQEELSAASPRGRGQRKGVEFSENAAAARPEATTLDRVHASMLLQASGRTNALRALLKAEQERGPYFLRLANALSALYPKHSEEKRLLDAMLLAMPR